MDTPPPSAALTETNPLEAAELWITFLRTFSPQAANSGQYDEKNKWLAEECGIPQFEFEHPFEKRAISYLTGQEQMDVNLVLVTGTAGDGKTRITHNAWKACGGDPALLNENDNYFITELPNGRILHLVRDMSALSPDDGGGWKLKHLERLKNLCDVAAKSERSNDIYLVATNDGQFLEAMRALQSEFPDDDSSITKLLTTFESLLLDDDETGSGFIRCINMSLQPSAEIFDLALAAFLGHPNWNTCQPNDDPSAFFGPNCYVRKNLEILKTDQFQKRLRSLIQLCDLNDTHISVRQILILLSNALLGSTAAQERSLGVPEFDEYAEIIRKQEWSSGSIYSNILGGNLVKQHGRTKPIFEDLNRFQIGYETTNIIDTMLIFGKEDPEFSTDYNALVGNDTFYGATPQFAKLQRAYLDANEDDGEDTTSKKFSAELVNQRRRLFFTLPDENAKYPYWALSVFPHADEYLKSVVAPLKAGSGVNLGLRKQIVLGLNQIFIGLLVEEKDSIFLATSGTHSQARVSRIVEDELPVDEDGKGTVQVELGPDGKPILVIKSFNIDWPVLPLTLTRFEFIVRVAAGALPTSFSKECFVDIATFKTKLLSHFAGLKKTAANKTSPNANIKLRLLQVTPHGAIKTQKMELIP